MDNENRKYAHGVYINSWASTIYLLKIILLFHHHISSMDNNSNLKIVALVNYHKDIMQRLLVSNRHKFQEIWRTSKWKTF